MPTTPATMGPEFKPMRMLSAETGMSSSLCRTTRSSSKHAIMSMAMKHASSACRDVRLGQPPTTMYTSPTVSTCVCQKIPQN